MAEGADRRGGASGAMGKRVPSFFTSPSLVNLSGLGVGDQTLLNVQQQQNTGRVMRQAGSATDLMDGSAPTMDSGSENGDGGAQDRYNPPEAVAGTTSPGARSSKSDGAGGDSDGYVKTTTMASFYYRKTKSNENMQLNMAKNAKTL
jgi:hypothetical protein